MTKVRANEVPMNKCRHPDCTNLKESVKYACTPHWYELPSTIRAKIWRGYRGDGRVWLEADKEAQSFWIRERNKKR